MSTLPYPASRQPTSWPSTPDDGVVSSQASHDPNAVWSPYTPYTPRTITSGGRTVDLLAGDQTLTPTQAGSPAHNYRASWAPQNVAYGPDPGGYYLSDTGYLRSTPAGMADAYSAYIHQTQQPPQWWSDLRGTRQFLHEDPFYAAQWLQQAQQYATLPTDLAQRYRQDIDYLRARPGEGEYERAYLTSAAENIDRLYDAKAQRIIENAARRGLDPSSGPVQELLAQNEEARTQDKARAHRDIAMWQVNEQRSRVAEARGIEGQLEALERLRQTTGRGIEQLLEAQRLDRLLRALSLGQTLDQSQLQRRGLLASIFREIDALERQRRAEARGVESALDQAERQRLLDLLSFLSGTQPPSGPAALATQQALYAQQAFGNAMSDFGNTLAYLFGSQTPNSAFTLPPTSPYYYPIPTTPDSGIPVPY